MLMLMLSRKADEHKHYLFHAPPLYPFMTFFNLSTGEGKQRWPLGWEHFPSQGVAASVGDEDWGANGGNILFSCVWAEKSLVRKAGTRLTHTTQETLSSRAMSFSTTWRQITGFHRSEDLQYLFGEIMYGGHITDYQAMTSRGFSKPSRVG